MPIRSYPERIPSLPLCKYSQRDQIMPQNCRKQFKLYFLRIGGCADDEYCPNQVEAYCKKIVPKKEDGESCSDNSDCKSALCQDGKCID